MQDDPEAPDKPKRKAYQGPKCGAKCRDGSSCPNPPMANGRCRMHGGASLPPGPDHPRWRGGKHSKYWQVLPANLGERYEAALQDTELLALRDELALLDAFLQDALSRMDKGDVGALWIQLRELWAEFALARKSGDVGAMDRLLDDIGRLIQRGASDALARREVREMMDDRRRLAESERKREVEAQITLDLRTGQAFLLRVLASVETHVSDKRILAAIASDLRPLLAAPAGG